MISSDFLITTDTPLAAYLVQQGFDLLSIQYSQRLNGKQQASFIFTDSPDIRHHRSLYNSGEAIINLALYEHAKSSLLDRVMRGLP